ncbi:serine hydrolase domain-containing protein [Kitasatospora sp. NPDC093102]|uniref:serine hydrolase domain-containing protein n=1 Tax=Kitasatospora sp. NPDC093102 TaxID=3155069 RepID=UPI0034483E0E
MPREGSAPPVPSSVTWAFSTPSWYQSWTSVLALAALGLFLQGLTPAHAAGPAAGNGTPPSSPDPGEVRALFDGLVPRLLAEHRIPGAAVTVVAGGREVFSGGYGVSDVRTNKPVDPARTAFFMGSDAKVFTAIAVLQQVAAGKLDLGTDVNHYLTAFQVRDSYPGRPAAGSSTRPPSPGCWPATTAPTRACPAWPTCWNSAPTATSSCWSRTATCPVSTATWPCCRSAASAST